MRNSTNLIRVWLILGLLFVYLISYTGMHYSIDEMSALAISESILQGRSWSVNQMEWEQLWEPSQNVFGVDGNLYSKKGLGVSLLALPLYFVGKSLPMIGGIATAKLLGIILTALTALFLFETGVQLGFRPLICVSGTLAWGLGTLAWPYARTLFPEPLSAFAVAITVYGCSHFQLGLGAKHKWLLVSSLGISLLILAKSANVVIALPFVGYVLFYLLLWHRESLVHGWKNLFTATLWFGVPIGVTLLIIIVHNYLRFHRLFSYPLVDPREGFITPPQIGLVGILFSPGKGLLWYVPLLLLIPFVFKSWKKRQQMHYALLLLAAFVANLLLYAGWADWSGGRAWGPRMVLPTLPALAILLLPAWQQMLAAKVKSWQRVVMIALLLVSVAFQLLGVLVSAEVQEGVDLRNGVTLPELHWQWQYSPLLTYWQAIVSPAIDPLLLQPFLWQKLSWQSVALGLTLLTLFGALLLGIRNLWRAKASLPTMYTAIASTLLAFFLLPVVAAQDDPRWHEATVDPSENQQIIAYLSDNAGPGDLVLLDLISYFAYDARAWYWMNEFPLEPPTIAWLRKVSVTQPDQAQLARWIEPYSRVWLALTGTVEDLPDSTTEQILDNIAVRGRQQWFGTQRLVEYFVPAVPVDSAASLTASPSAIQFGNDGPVLDSYALFATKLPNVKIVRLDWQNRTSDTLRYSVQALGPSGQLAYQLDGKIGRLKNSDRDSDSYVDLIGIMIDTDDPSPNECRLILKIYDSNSGTVLQPSTTDKLYSGEALALSSFQCVRLHPLQ